MLFVQELRVDVSGNSAEYGGGTFVDANTIQVTKTDGSTDSVTVAGWLRDSNIDFMRLRLVSLGVAFLLMVVAVVIHIVAVHLY